MKLTTLPAVLLVSLSVAALMADDRPAAQTVLHTKDAGKLEGEQLTRVRELGLKLFSESPVHSVLGPLDNPGVMKLYEQIAKKDHLRMTFDRPWVTSAAGEELVIHEVLIALTGRTFKGLPRSPYAIISVDKDRRLVNSLVSRGDVADELGKAVATVIAPADAADADADAPDRPATQPALLAELEEQEQLHERVNETAKAMYDHLTRPAAGDERPSPELVYQWSRRVDSDLGQPDWDGHLVRMQQRLKEEEALHAAGKVPLANVLAYRYYVAEAEQQASLWKQLKDFSSP